jgi:uncharacterized protein (DUF2141 family)
VLRLAFAVVLLICAAFIPATSSLADNAPVSANLTRALRIEVSGIRAPGGHVRVDVCPQDEFLKDCRYGGSAPATVGVTTVWVANLPPGVYAAQAYHDRNDNHEVDRNVFGLPTEAVGFSNNAKIRLHPPSFRSAAFSYDGGQETISFHLQHFAD